MQSPAPQVQRWEPWEVENLFRKTLPSLKPTASKFAPENRPKLPQKGKVFIFEPHQFSGALAVSYKEWSHIPPKWKRNIIDSKFPFKRGHVCSQEGIQNLIAYDYRLSPWRLFWKGWVYSTSKSLGTFEVVLEISSNAKHSRKKGECKKNGTVPCSSPPKPCIATCHPSAWRA